MTETSRATEFYETTYDLIGCWLVRPTDKIVLGDKANRKCRFCGEKPPEATFRKQAHAIPESLGNKSIETTYECDDCNSMFGQGIEQDLGNWSKPMRTFARIRGKSGVPTLKRGGNTGWRIEHDNAGFHITAFEDDPFFEVNEANNTIAFKLKRDPYTPVAVLKAFMKIGLTLLPESEVQNFRALMAWVRSPDHARLFAEKCPVIYTFQPGPMPNDLMAAFILRRKAGVQSYPYAFLVLGYGNEVFQVQLPSEKHDTAMNGQTVSILPFPSPGSPQPEAYGPPGRTQIDLTGREVIKGEAFPLTVGFESINKS